MNFIKKQIIYLMNMNKIDIIEKSNISKIGKILDDYQL